MSFQGDVAGIGLGELLQGLSRGGRDGVLSLYGEKISACLGLHRGQLFLLASPDEDQETWRERCQQAFALDPYPEKEQARRADIARAARQEAIFEMLAAHNLHFRFEPGPLPLPPGRSTETRSAGAIALEGAGGAADAFSAWGAGITVEYMLLEYARISDESSSASAASIRSFDLPRAVDVNRQNLPEVRDFLDQCDACSTVQEIADRLGRPQIEVANLIGSHVQSGNLRLAGPREILVAAQYELENGRIGRACARLSGWVESAPAGPPSMGDAEMLVREWERGRLQHLLPSLKPRIARSLMRKLDRVHVNKEATHNRWKALLEAHRSDEATNVHEVTLRLTGTEEPDSRTFNDILRLARSFQDRGLTLRTKTMLRLASSHLPKLPRTRIELGRRMIEAGLVAEGTRWLLNTAHTLIAEKLPDSALAPLQAILREDPENEDAIEMLAKVRALLASQKRRKLHSALGLSITAMLSLVALVRYSDQRKINQWEGKFQLMQTAPSSSLIELQDAFGDDAPERIVELKKSLTAILRTQEAQKLQQWQSQFDAAMEACSFGDPLLGLQRTFELRPRPGPSSALAGSHIQDLLGALASKLEERSLKLVCNQDATANERNHELRFLDELKQIAELSAAKGAPLEAASFAFHIKEMIVSIEERRGEWSVEHATTASKEKATRHSILLATARAHANSGDLERALIAYDRLLSEDPSLHDVTEFQEEISRARAHAQGARLAFELAQEGDHDGAADALREVCARPLEHALPFQVNSRPQGAQVVMGSGEVHTTPFVLKSGVGEAVELTFSKLGFERRKLQLTQPRDLDIQLNKIAERRWDNRNKIETLPVASGDDHILADRHGRIRRMDNSGQAVWSLELKTLSGIARTPIYMPGIPGHMLVVSEDGQAWIVNARSGEIQGPRQVNSPPVLGPLLTRGGVSVSFANGQVGVWSDSIDPSFFENESYVSLEDEELQSSSMAVLRRSVDQGESLKSPWSKWSVEVMENEYRVVSPDGVGFSAKRDGEWIYMAWEAPKALIPEGRLWVSDAAGVRSYVPH